MKNLNIFLISDIHGNHDALISVLDKVKDYDYLLVLGDLVDYGPEPERVIDTLKSIGAIIIRGNHDNAVAYNIDCGCSEKTRDISIYTREKISFTKLSKEQILFLASLPTENEMKVIDHIIKIVHGSPRNHLFGYMYPWDIGEEICSSKIRINTSKNYENCNLSWDFLFIGHTHYQFSLRLGQTLIVNPGSIGQPRDGDPRASFTEIIIDGEELRINHHKVKYESQKVIRKLEELLDDKYLLEKLKRILLHGRVF